MNYLVNDGEDARVSKANLWLENPDLGWMNQPRRRRRRRGRRRSGRSAQRRKGEEEEAVGEEKGVEEDKEEEEEGEEKEEEKEEGGKKKRWLDKAGKTKNTQKSQIVQVCISLFRAF